MNRNKLGQFDFKIKHDSQIVKTIKKAMWLLVIIYVLLVGYKLIADKYAVEYVAEPVALPAQDDTDMLLEDKEFLLRTLSEFNDHEKNLVLIKQDALSQIQGIHAQVNKIDEEIASTTETKEQLKEDIQKVEEQLLYLTK